MAVSIHTRFHEQVGKLTPAQWNQFKEWREAAGGYPAVSVEVQCHKLDSMLKEQPTHREAIRKNNGRADNNGELFTESASDGGADVPSTLKEAHKLAATYIKCHRLSEQDARKVVGLPTKTFKESGLNQKQYQLFELFCLAGRPESEALRMAKG